VAKVKIKHGLAFYFDESGENPVQLTAFRTQVIDVSAKEAKRLKSLGAAVDVDEELPLLGRITPLPNTASDEELLAWVSVASRSEIAQAVEDRPELGDRILAARDTIQERMEAQQELLSGISSDIKKAQERAQERAQVEEEEEDLIGEGEEEGEGEGEGEELHDNPDEIVKGNVEAVSKYLSENPDQAQVILDAETRRADALRASGDKRAKVREGVVQAAQAAAAHFASQ